MKKLTISLGILFSTLTGTFCPTYANNLGHRNAFPTPFCGGFTFGITGLYWRPSTDHIDNALIYPFDAFVPFVDGDYRSIDDEYSWDFKANIGYVFPCSGRDITLTYTHYNQDDIDHIHNPGQLLNTLTNNWNTLVALTAVDIPSITVSAIIGGLPFTGTIPATIISIPIINPDVANARADFKADVLDLDFAQSINLGRNFRLRWFGGLRYANLEHKFNATYLADIASSTEINESVLLSGTTLITVDIDFDMVSNIRDIVNQKSDFKGIGPRFGVESNYHLGGGFGFVGGISVALLVGEINSSLFTHIDSATTAAISSISSSLIPPDTLTLLIDGTVIDVGTSFASSFTDTASFKHPDETRIVPNIDAKLGLDYSYQFCNRNRSKLTIEAGWMVSHYFNSIDRLSATAANNPELRSRQTIDTSFDGPYIGIQVTI